MSSNHLGLSARALLLPVFCALKSSPVLLRPPPSPVTTKTRPPICHTPEGIPGGEAFVRHFPTQSTAQLLYLGTSRNLGQTQDSIA